MSGIDVAFIVVMAFGWLISAFTAPPEKVVRTDRTLVQDHGTTKRDLRLKEQLKAAWVAYGDWKILVLIPML